MMNSPIYWLKMNFRLKHIIAHRETIFLVLCVLVFFTFTISYAISNISIFLFIPFFFLDTKLNLKKKWNYIKNDKVVLIYAFFFFIQCIGYFYSANSTFALRRVEVMLPLLFLPAILFSESITSNTLLKALNVSKYLIVLTFTYLVIVHVFIDESTLSNFVHHTVEEKLGISQFYLTFILLTVILNSINDVFVKRHSIINAIVLVLAFFFLVILGNKTVMFFVFVLVLVSFIKLIRRNRYKGAIALLFFVLIGAGILSQTNIVKNRTAVFVKTIDFDLQTIITKNKYTITKNTLEHRVLINYLAGKEILKALPFGVGTGDFMDVLVSQYHTVNFKAGINDNLNNHNQFLEEFLKTGLLGGILFISLLYLLVLRITKQQFYYPIILVFFITGCFLESYLYRQHGVIIFAFLIPYFYKVDKQT